jgi:hypothetical protein
MAARSDSVGHYEVVAPIAGPYAVSFQRSGLATLNLANVNLDAGRNVVIDTAMTMEATALPGVKVVGKGIVERNPGNPHKYDEFLKRKALGVGHFLTREDIDAHANAHTPELFNNIAGLKVRTRGTTWFLQSQRCSGRFIPGLGPMGQGTPTHDLDPVLFLDGNKVDISVLYELVPSQIEAIEVYQGSAQLPAAAKGNACFAIFVWLRN